MGNLEDKSIKDIVTQYGEKIYYSILALIALDVVVVTSGGGAFGWFLMWILLWVGGNVKFVNIYYTTVGQGQKLTKWLLIAFNALFFGWTLYMISG